MLFISEFSPINLYHDSPTKVATGRAQFKLFCPETLASINIIKLITTDQNVSTKKPIVSLSKLLLSLIKPENPIASIIAPVVKIIHKNVPQENFQQNFELPIRIHISFAKNIICTTGNKWFLDAIHRQLHAQQF